MMAKITLYRIAAFALFVALVLAPTGQSLGQQPAGLSDCRELAFSLSEDFVTQGPTPPDGNPIISDGDLLGLNGKICARNRDLLLNSFDVDQDMGLDAADVINLKSNLLAFSTELDSPHGNFKAGDLLTNHGAAVPNQALMAKFGQHPDMGLDAVHFVGETDSIGRFLEFARKQGRSYWLQNPAQFAGYLQEYGVDLWFSIEGTVNQPGAVMILDGDLLSAAQGTVVFRNGDWLTAPIPAGLPQRGVDLGLDAFGADCNGSRETARFSTEILYRGVDGSVFTDGDILKWGGALEWHNFDLIAPFEPRARMLGLDALSYPHYREECGEREEDYLPMILRLYGK